jgi:RNA polymerase sigma-70 factor (ECF subfamily)
MAGAKPNSDVVGAARSDAAVELEALYVGLVRDYHRRIYNYLYRMLGETGLAEDIAQEVYLRAYKALPRLPAGANHRAWLFRIATNAATDEIRRRRRRPDVLLGLAPTHKATNPSEDERLGRVCLDGALSAIAPHHRAVLMLFEFAGFSAPEVGEVLGVKPETARKRRQRAREALARELDGVQLSRSGQQS